MTLFPWIRGNFVSLFCFTNTNLIEKDAKKVGYNGPMCTVRHVPRVLHQKDAKILDMCAGTGGCAIEVTICYSRFFQIIQYTLCLKWFQLQKLGYNNVDALDGCKNMLGLAKLRNLYNNYFLHYLYPGQQTSVPSGFFVRRRFIKRKFLFQIILFWQKFTMAFCAPEAS